MKEVSNIKKITDAFTKDSNISEKIVKERRKICGECEFNSENKKNLTILEAARKKLHPNEPFCTACTCFISAKTNRGENECGLSEINKTPKWNKVILNTVDKMDLNIINKSEKDVNISLTKNGKSFLVNYGRIEGNLDKGIEFIVESKQSFNIEMLSPSCGFCTTPTYKRIGDRQFLVKIHLKLEDRGNFTKKVYITYRIGSFKRNVEVMLKGIINK